MRDTLNTLKSRMLSTFMILLAVGAVVFLGLWLSVMTVISTILGPTQTRIIRLKNWVLRSMSTLQTFLTKINMDLFSRTTIPMKFINSVRKKSEIISSFKRTEENLISFSQVLHILQKKPIQKTKNNLTKSSHNTSLG